MIRISPFAVLVLFAVAVAHAQEKPAVETLSLSLTNAGEPRPALLYTLWRQPRDRQPGNGAPFYYRAMLLAESSREALNKEYPPKRVEMWLTMPLAEIPAKEISAYLDQYRLVFGQLETATAREHCEWDLRVDQLRGNAVISFLLPDFQKMRDLARLVAFKARYQISQRQYDDAIATLRIGYQMARDAAEPPLLINALIGIAIGAQMNGVLLDLIDADDSPNMYWALKQLPQPLVDIRPALQFELSMPYQMFPFLVDAETTERTPEEWQRLTQTTLADLNALSTSAGATGVPNLQDWQIRLTATAVMLKAYPTAKKQLLDEGMAKDVVEKMPVGQVIAIQAARNYRYTYNEVFKWTLLPYTEGSQHLRKSMERLKQEGYLGQALGDKEVFPIATLLMPSIDSVLLASARSDRRRAAIETIEAIRLHTAARSGELPSTLTDLAVAPSPQNPFTGKPLDYRREEHRAVLEERAPDVEAVRANDRIYLIELIKQVK